MYETSTSLFFVTPCIRKVLIIYNIYAEEEAMRIYKDNTMFVAADIVDKKDQYVLMY